MWLILMSKNLGNKACHLPYKLLKTFCSFVTSVKSGHSPKITCEKITMFSLSIFMNITETVKRNESFFDFGGSWREKRDICKDVELCLKVHSLISVQHKSIKLRQMIQLYVVLRVVVSNYRLVKI